MEQLYPLNILERELPILKEKREKAEREAAQRRSSDDDKPSDKDMDAELAGYLHVNRPLEDGRVGTRLNTIA